MPSYFFKLCKCFVCSHLPVTRKRRKRCVLGGGGRYKIGSKSHSNFQILCFSGNNIIIIWMLICAWNWMCEHNLCFKKQLNFLLLCKHFTFPHPTETRKGCFWWQREGIPAVQYLTRISGSNASLALYRRLVNTTLWL